MRCALCLFLFLLLMLVVGPLQADWNLLPIGPSDAAPVVADSSGQRILGVTSAGIWITDNGGTSWRSVNSDLPQGQHISATGCQMLDADGDTLLITAIASFDGTEGTNLHSFDGGRTWQQNSGVAGYGGQVVALRGHSNIWLCFLDTLLFRSTDCGQTWSDGVRFSARNSVRLAEDPQRDSVLYCSQAETWRFPNDTLFRSTDLGQSWSPLVHLRRFMYAEDEYFDMGDVVRLSDGELLLPFIHNLRTSSPDEAWIYEAVSADEGLTWLLVAVPSFGALEQIVDASLPLVSVAEDWRHHPGRLFISSQCRGGLLYSNDYGRNWYENDSTALRDRRCDLYQNPYSGDIYKGLSKYRWQDERWQVVNGPPIGAGGWGDISFAGGGTFCSVTRTESSWLWEVAGANTAWHSLRSLLSGDSAMLLGAPFFKHDDTLMACASGWALWGAGQDVWKSWIVSSYDDGGTWNFGPYLEHALRPSITAYPRAGATPMLFGYDYDQNTSPGHPRILKSEDLGGHWQGIAMPASRTGPPEQFIAIDSTYYALFSYAYRSTDQGATWDQMSGAVFNSYSARLSVVNGELYGASEFPDHVFRLAGSQWEDRGGLPTRPADYAQWRMAAVPPSTLVGFWMWSDSTAIWFSSDSGRTWESRDIALPYADLNTYMRDIAFDSVRNRIWLSCGVGTCYLDVAELSSTGRPLQFKPADYTVLAAYPNPFNSTTRIRFDLAKRQRVKLDLFDLQGRLVRTLTDGMMDAGRQEITFDGDGLASGTYFVRLKSAEVVRTEKILLLK